MFDIFGAWAIITAFTVIVGFGYLTYASLMETEFPREEKKED